jgi:hypothetical protein
VPASFDIPIGDDIKKQCLLVGAVLHHHTSKYLPTIVLQLADVVLLECLCSLADLSIVLKSLSVSLPVSLCPMETAAKLESLLLVFRPILPENGHFPFLDEQASRGGTGRVVGPRALLLGALKACALLGAAVQALEFQACLVDASHIRDDLLVVHRLDVRLGEIESTHAVGFAAIVCGHDLCPGNVVGTEAARWFNMCFETQANLLRLRPRLFLVRPPPAFPPGSLDSDCVAGRRTEKTGALVIILFFLLVFCLFVLGLLAA